MLAHLLFRRGFETAETIRSFLAGEPISHDPFLLPSMEEAIARIAFAAERGERVAVYGDFDCDGVTAAAMLMETLRGLGLDPLVYIPIRSEGHGLSPEGIAELAGEGVTLVVTADCGISAIEEVAVARALGMDVIVTDHHEPRAGGVLPDCPVVAPTRYDSLYPFRSLCGAGVAYKLAQGLAARLPMAPDPAKVLDLVALGTVADVVPLRDENRTLVVTGLQRLRRTERPGLLALLEVAGIERSRIDSVSIGFYLAPRLNAANRIADSRIAYDLITACDRDIAAGLAAQLNTLNRERQELVSECLVNLIESLGAPDSIARDVAGGDRVPLLFVQGAWPAGISGLLASKLVDLYGLPVFVGAISGDEIAVSGRASGEIHIDELLERCEAAFPEGIFLGYGGHARAGGFRVRAQDLELAVTELQKQARLHVEAAAVGSVLEIDAELPLRRLTIQAAQLVRTLAPFGADFLEPIFLTRDVIIRRLESRGDGKHASFQVADGESAARGISFNADPDFFALRLGERVDLVYHLQLNEWQGSLRPELRLRDWRRSA